MADQVTNYKCPACGGALRFDIPSGKLVCDYCDSVFTVRQVEELYAGADAQAQAAFQQAEAGAAAEAAFQKEPVPETAKTELIHSKWDGSTISDDWGEEGANMRSFVCPSCGGEVICDRTTAATQCPFCGNPSIVSGQFSGMKPDLIIPFKLDKDAAVSALKQHFRKRPFLPKTFTSSSQIKKIQGVYVPFWLFSGNAEADCVFLTQNSMIRREGDYRVTTTDHFDVRRSGTARFLGIPTDASKKMPDSLMDSLEPFNYKELKPFSTAYLPGYLADKYDVTVEESAQRADKRCTNTILELVERDVAGYQSVTLRQKNVRIDREKVQYALLPVWVMCVKWQDKNYLYAMNGQTGKFVGDLPVDKNRFWTLCGSITAALTALLFFTGAGEALVRFIQYMLA